MRHPAKSHPGKKRNVLLQNTWQRRRVDFFGEKLGFNFFWTHIHTNISLKPASFEKETRGNLNNLNIRWREVGKHCMTAILIARHRRACTNSTSCCNGISPLRYEKYENLPYFSYLSYLSPFVSQTSHISYIPLSDVRSAHLLRRDFTSHNSCLYPIHHTFCSYHTLEGRIPQRSLHELLVILTNHWA